MCLSSGGKRRRGVSSNVSEFGRKYFCSPGSNFCFCKRSQCFQIWDTGKHLSKHWKSRTDFRDNALTFGQGFSLAKYLFCSLIAVAEIHFFRRGVVAQPPKFPTKLSNFRQTPPFALEKTVFSSLLCQNFRKLVNFPWRWGGGGGGGGVGGFYLKFELQC
jgi:hypothetical protein